MFIHSKVFEDTLYIKFLLNKYRRIKNWTPTFTHNGCRYTFKFIYFIEKTAEEKFRQVIKARIELHNKVDRILHALKTNDDVNVTLDAIAKNIYVTDNVSMTFKYKECNEFRDGNIKYHIYTYGSY